MTRRDKSRELRSGPRDLNGLRGGQARGVLATLIVAACWPERYPGGAVPARDLPKSVPDLTADSRAIRQAVLRSDLQFRSHGIALNRDRRGPGGGTFLALSTALSPSIENWLYRMGWRHLKPEFWGRFLMSRVKPPATAEQALRSTHEVVLQQLAYRGDIGGAVCELETALSRTTDSRQRANLVIARSLALIRRGMGWTGEEPPNGGLGLRPPDWEEAHESLLALIAPGPGGTDIRDRILAARIGLTLAYIHFHTDVMSNSDPQLIDREIRRAREWLRPARALTTVLQPSDRAQLLNVAALLISAEAAVTDGPIREELCVEAQEGLLSAFAQFHFVADVLGVAAVLHNLGEIHYVRHGLDGLPTNEQAIEETLEWFRASVRALEMVRADPTLASSTRARIADLLGSLAVVRCRAGLRSELGKLFCEAQNALADAIFDSDALSRDICERTNIRLNRVSEIINLPRWSDKPWWTNQAPLSASAKGKARAARRTPGLVQREPGNNGYVFYT